MNRKFYKNVNGKLRLVFKKFWERQEIVQYGDCGTKQIWEFS